METKKYVWREPTRARYEDGHCSLIPDVDFIEMDVVKTDGCLIEVSELSRVVRVVKRNFIKKLIHKIENTASIEDVGICLLSELRELELK